VHATLGYQNVTATLPYPSSYLILSHSSSWRSYFCTNVGYFWGAIFVQMLDIFEIFAFLWSKVAWFGQVVVLQINYDIKVQNYQLWHHYGDITSSKWHHKNFPFLIFKPPTLPLAKSWLRPWVQCFSMQVVMGSPVL